MRPLNLNFFFSNFVSLIFFGNSNFEEGRKNPKRSGQMQHPNGDTSIIKHNHKLLQEKLTPATPPALCNCWKNTTCPLSGECCSRSLVYKAELTCDNITKYLDGLCEATFKHGITITNMPSDTKVSITRQNFPKHTGMQ